MRLACPARWRASWSYAPASLLLPGGRRRGPAAVNVTSGRSSTTALPWSAAPCTPPRRVERPPRRFACASARLRRRREGMRRHPGRHERHLHRARVRHRQATAGPHDRHQRRRVERTERLPAHRRRPGRRCRRLIRRRRRSRRSTATPDADGRRPRRADGDGHAEPTATADGHAEPTVDGHADVDGHGHARADGHGHGHGRADRRGHGPATATATPPPAAVFNVAPPVITGLPVVGNTLVSSFGRWEGTPPFLITRRWQRCPGDESTCMDVPLRVSDTYTVQAADVGNRLRIIVKASNGGGSALAASALFGPLMATGPAPRRRFRRRRRSGSRSTGGRAGPRLPRRSRDG